MSHRNKNLVLTDGDMETLIDNKRSRDEDDKSEVRRSKRLANKEKHIQSILNGTIRSRNRETDMPNKKKSYIIDDDEMETQVKENTSASLPHNGNLSTEKQKDTPKIYESNSEDDSIESLGSDDTVEEEESLESGDEIMTEADKNFIVPDDENIPKLPMSRRGNSLLKSLFGRGLDGPTDEYGETYDELMAEEWFRELGEDKKKEYVNKMLEIQKPKDHIPTIGEILDYNIGRENIKELLIQRYEIDKCDRLSVEYDDACHKLLKKIAYFTDPERMKNNNDLEKTKNEILSQDKFSQSLRDRILASKFDNKIKMILYDKYTLMQNTEGDEVAKLGEWIETVLSLPHSTQNAESIIPDSSRISEIICKTMEALDKKVYGMAAAKEEFICMLTNILGNPKSKNKAIGLYGPPGIGKTMLAMIISEVLNKPMAKISLGGITDSSFLEGHGYTYIGAQPGCITKATIQMKTTSGIIYLDEIDKISKSEHGKEIEHALLHITDFTQNHDFRDKYMPEIPQDLSDHIFIYSLNSLNEMDNALASRIPVIRFDGYSPVEKIEILQKYMLPELLSNYGMTDGDVIIPNDVAQHLIKNVKEIDTVNHKSGVRNLKNIMTSIFNRINLYRLASIDGKLNIKLSFTIRDFKMPYVLDMELTNAVLTHYNNKDNDNENQSYKHMYI